MENRTFTLNDIRFMFNAETVIYLVRDIYDETETYIVRTDKIKISDNHLLWGSSGFGTIPVYPNQVYVIGKNKVEIKTLMPKEIFAAWMDYAKQNKRNGGII